MQSLRNGTARYTDLLQSLQWHQIVEPAAPAVPGGDSDGDGTTTISKTVLMLQDQDQQRQHKNSQQQYPYQYNHHHQHHRRVYLGIVACCNEAVAVAGGWGGGVVTGSLQHNRYCASSSTHLPRSLKQAPHCATVSVSHDSSAKR